MTTVKKLSKIIERSLKTIGKGNKKYIQDLEKQNTELKWQLSELSKQNSQLKDKIKSLELQVNAENKSIRDSMVSLRNKMPVSEITNEALKRNETFILDTVPKLIKETPYKVTYTLMCQSNELIGVFGNQRIAFLKK